MTNQQEAATVERAIDGPLTKRGLAPKLQISPRTLSYWMKRGWVPYIKIGKTVRFKFEDVVAKLNARRVN